MSVPQSDGPVGASVPESGDKIDRIRDILLGGSLDELRNRLEALESRLLSLETSFPVEIEKRTDSLESGLSARIDEHSASQESLHHALSEEVDALRRETSDLRTHFEAALERASARLDANKVDRAALSRAFADIAAWMESADSVAKAGRDARG